MVKVVDAKTDTAECPKCPEGHRKRLSYAHAQAKDGDGMAVMYRCPDKHTHFVGCPIIECGGEDEAAEKFAKAGFDPLPVWYATPRS
jgi:hypothetical protein